MSKINTSDDVTALRTKSKICSNKRIVCYGCNEPGHKRPECPMRKKNSLKKKKAEKSKDSTSLCALGATSYSSVDKCYLFRGVTFFEDRFSDLKNPSVSILISGNVQGSDQILFDIIDSSTLQNDQNIVQDPIVNRSASLQKEAAQPCTKESSVNFSLPIDHEVGFLEPENSENFTGEKSILYGLKQAPREWNKTLDSCLSMIGCRP
ncbi:hypothetical protein ACJJTC_008752 [Scirpophaga incertulas]